ncbi:ABC transporter permease [Lacticaseibacillus daqingensis]|uniref:ABC transporter permease n=1 Tax=Lacticaseibacillus daqingensis TaxID=2486014 RepID=UPI000F78C83D|nr:ABC transporter permease [Lacticaseibacillus daqingensis]
MTATKLGPDAFKPVRVAATEKEKIAAPTLTFTQDALRRLRQNKAALLSLWVLLVIVVLAVVTQWWSPADPNAQNLAYAYLPPKWGQWHIPGFDGRLNGVDLYAQNRVPKAVYFLLGTDEYGRDLLSRIFVGTRVSLQIGFIATFFDLVIGVSYGLLSGWLGGRVDLLMQRVIEIISSVPSLVVVILMLLVFRPGMLSIILAIAVTGWITMARLVRAQTLQLKRLEYVLAAQTLGEPGLAIAWRHLLPNLSSTVIIQTMFTIPTAIFFEAFLSYIGIGIPAPAASLGTLLANGQQSLQTQPYLLIFPGIVIVVLMLAFNLLGDGLRDAFDPRTDR